MAGEMPVGPTRIRLPDPSALDVTDPEALAAYLRTLNTALALALQQRPATTQPTATQLLQSPNGSVYSLRVDDAGGITTKLERSNVPVP